ncbi:MAG: hypothetical protein UW43_C0001G0025 [Candidatus Yanofskybacteria bacterium GW2011_GWA1_44_21]|uniref:DUF1573 domain-containing protein n=2 Tax=Candidatus Yanofskyibacteriota TaxID=1752733 RepID=A0A1F8H0F4_9BACT|nr:MAG: hypothetical protein UW14_C0006G0017 [Candidatus Yanofskybacteria bacterium GW2011_GWA2_44_10]KKT50860.1 MAG: hypothetical protein UW43_C0001G0025 [Candidatus Yanofskybacteria bacterium GW2011_GWA1_44_21]KKT90432.1 MAG: hypothetical protein UW90_C0001G0020 [Candidatus Yanofskybacteria bacterium GW2011_GWB1_45_11]OGN02280.1 MAG: hypothetical protein A2657_00835 [Candidatus Yanofskybacteria bacterium RIFCSPHIGHO2_01_FULL_44_110b]OGN14238.1 MAG: hypothetical protein A3C01_01425 [Candidatus
MNKQTLIIIAGVVVIVAGFIWLARPAADTIRKEEKTDAVSDFLEIPEKYYDFGNISMANGNVSHAFKVKNAGSEKITLDKMYTSCMCTSAVMQLNGKEYGPFGMPGHVGIPKINAMLELGDEAVIEIVFDPNAHGPAGIGKIERTVIIENSAGGPIMLNFSANVTP